MFGLFLDLFLYMYLPCSGDAVCLKEEVSPPYESISAWKQQDLEALSAVRLKLKLFSKNRV